MLKRSRYLEQVQLFLNKPVIKVLTGMRRVGKSTLLGQIREGLLQSGVPEEHILLINKDLLAWDHVRSYRDLDSEVGKALRGVSGARYILIDEVQEIDQWERAITSFLAEGLGDIIITGSNAHLLSSELSTLLTGRYIEIPMFPLGLQEFIQLRSMQGHHAPLDEAFRVFLRFGGMPGIHQLDLVDEQVFPYLEAILNTLLLKDVVRRNEVRDVHNLERILAFVFDNVGSLVSTRKIAGFLKNQGASISVDTVGAYLGYLSQAMLLDRVGRFSIKGKRHLEYLDKYYVTDLGLRHGLFGYRGGDIGALLENIVYQELRRRGYEVHVGVLDGTEIDFVAERHDQRIYLQVAYLLAEEATVQREFGNLERITDNYPKLVLSLDEYFPPERNGIIHQNIREFLMSDEFV